MPRKCVYQNKKQNKKQPRKLGNETAKKGFDVKVATVAEEVANTDSIEEKWNARKKT
jgi:hypothetical protein